MGKRKVQASAAVIERPEASQTVTLPTFSCLRCEHTWMPRKPAYPITCPKCKSAYWDKPRQKDQ